MVSLKKINRKKIKCVHGKIIIKRYVYYLIQFEDTKIFESKWISNRLLFGCGKKKKFNDSIRGKILPYIST